MEKISKLRSFLADGCLAAFYTLDSWFVKIYPVLSIDKVKFSFAEKGKKGKGFDVYVDTPVFLLLCRDILSGRLWKLIEADKSDYPSAWNYRTGQNGTKELHLGKGKRGVVLQGRYNGGDEGGKCGFIPLSCEDLRIMAELFLMVTGVTPVEGYWKDLRDLCLKGMEKTEEARKAFFSEEDEPLAEAAAPAEEAPVKAPAKEPAEKQGQVILDCRTIGAFFPVDTAANVKKPAEEQVTKVAVSLFDGKNLEDTPSEVIFYKTQRNKTGDWYSRLVKAAEKSPIRIRVVVTPCGERDGKKQFIFQKQA